MREREREASNDGRERKKKKRESVVRKAFMVQEADTSR